MISYIIQCALSFASVVALVPLLFLRPGVHGSYTSLANLYTLAQWWFSMAVLISVVVRSAQGPSFSERFLLDSLSQVQLGCAMASFTRDFLYKANVGFQGQHDELDFIFLQTRGKVTQLNVYGLMKLLVPMFLAVTCFGVYIRLELGPRDLILYLQKSHGILVSNPDTRECLNYLAESCNSYDDNTPLGPVISWCGYITAAAIAVLLILLLYKRNRRYILYAYAGIYPTTLFFHLWQTAFLVQFFYRRQSINAFAKDDYGDNDWGFGQVLSVFGWIPTVFQGVLWIWKAIIHRSGRSDQVHGSGSSLI